jgi:hypothetical protein
MEGVQAIKVRIDNGMPIAVQADVLTVIHVSQNCGI